MGGKSTYMRQVAQIALLAYCGAFVPAKSARIGPLDRIFTRIGASDDLAGGRSTFMVEMTEAASILNNATPRSLVLVDEIGRGTSTFDGLALAYAIARHLAESDALLHALRDALLRAHAARRARSPTSPTSTSMRSSTRTASCSSTGSRAGRRTARTGSTSRTSRAFRKDVVRAARKHLAELEKQLRPASSQPDLFAAPAPRPSADAPSRCSTRSTRSSPTSSRPKEALEALYRLKKLADE